MLQLWYTATSNSYLSTEVAEIDDQDNISLWYSDNTHPNENQPTLGAQLSPVTVIDRLKQVRN